MSCSKRNCKPSTVSIRFGQENIYKGATKFQSPLSTGLETKCTMFILKKMHTCKTSCRNTPPPKKKKKTPLVDSPVLSMQRKSQAHN